MYINVLREDVRLRPIKTIGPCLVEGMDGWREGGRRSSFCPLSRSFTYIAVTVWGCHHRVESSGRHFNWPVGAAFFRRQGYIRRKAQEVQTHVQIHINKTWKTVSKSCKKLSSIPSFGP